MKIYLIKDGESRYKIGYSKNPKERLKQLQTAGATVFELIYELEVQYATKIEKALHRFFSRYNVNGEWFALPYEEVKSFPDLVRRTESNFKLIVENSTLKNPLS